MTWWEQKSELYKTVVQEIEASFPTLAIVKESGKVIVAGRWPVHGLNKHIIDYDVRIEFPDDYPDSVPKVWEVGNKIQKSQNRHFNPDDGNSACLFSRPERWEKWPSGSTLKDFLNGPVKEFFFSQAYFDLNQGEWPFDEWSHGEIGIIEYFASKLDLKDCKTIQKCLEIALTPKIERPWRCPCDKHERAKKCHGPKILELKRILPSKEIEVGIKIIDEQMRKGVHRVKLIPSPRTK